MSNCLNCNEPDKQVSDMDHLLFGDKTEQQVKDYIADQMGMQREGFIVSDDFVKKFRLLTVHRYLDMQKKLFKITTTI